MISYTDTPKKKVWCLDNGKGGDQTWEARKEHGQLVDVLKQLQAYVLAAIDQTDTVCEKVGIAGTPIPGMNGISLPRARSSTISQT